MWIYTSARLEATHHTVQVQHHQHGEHDAGDGKADEDHVRLVPDQKPPYVDALFLRMMIDARANQHSLGVCLLVHGSCVPVLHRLPLCVLVHVVLERERLSAFHQRTGSEVFQDPLIPVVVRAVHLVPHALRDERELHDVANLRVTRQTNTPRSSSQ